MCNILIIKYKYFIYKVYNKIYYNLGHGKYGMKINKKLGLIVTIIAFFNCKQLQVFPLGGI